MICLCQLLMSTVHANCMWVLSRQVAYQQLFVYVTFKTALALKHQDLAYMQEALQKSLAGYKEAVHRPPTDEDGPPVKMRSPTRKRHRLALSSSPAADTAVAAAGDMAAEAVLQAAAGAKTPAEAAIAAEHAAEVVKGAAADAVDSHASLPDGGSKGNQADSVEVGIAHSLHS